MRILIVMMVNSKGNYHDGISFLLNNEFNCYYIKLTCWGSNRSNDISNAEYFTAKTIRYRGNNSCALSHLYHIITLNKTN